MKSIERVVRLGAAAGFLALAGGTPALQAGERFTGTVVDTGGSVPGRSTVPLIAEVNEYSTDEEVAALAGVLAQGGAEALREALWDLEKGWIRVGGSLGYPIAAARSLPVEGGRVVRLMIDRPITFFEAVRNLRTTDYPFAFIEIRLDEEGKGEGQVIAAATVKLAAGVLEVESYGPQPSRLMAVRARETQ